MLGTDITCVTYSEKLLRKRTAFIETLLNAMPDAVLALGCRGGFYLNQRTVELWKMPSPVDGIDAVSLLRHMAGMTTEPDQFERLATCSGAEPGRRVRTEVELRDGTTLDALCSLISDGDGTRHGKLLVFRDVTHIRRVQRRLQESEERYRNLVDLAPVGIVIHAGDEVRFSNPAFARMVGAESAEVLAGLPLRNLLPLKKGYSLTDRVMNEEPGSGDVPAAARELLTLNGSPIKIDAVSFCLKHEDRDAVMTVVHDVTKRAGAREALKKERELRARSNDLAEMKTALKVLTKNSEEEMAMFQKAILDNVNETVVPYLDKLAASRLSEAQRIWLDMAGSNIKGIVSPFLRRIASLDSRLTPMEVEVANLIRNGKTSKEIAASMSICLGTVETHRNRIRRKLGIKNKDVNLRTYLLSKNEESGTRRRPVKRTSERG
jgi:PAS domain S-box-containing protein